MTELPEPPVRVGSTGFLLRFEVAYLLRPGNLKLVLAAPDPAASQIMTMADLRNAQAAVSNVTVTDETVDALIQIRDACKARWDRGVRPPLEVLEARAAVAFMAGVKKTSPEDLSILVLLVNIASPSPCWRRAGVEADP